MLVLTVAPGKDVYLEDRITGDLIRIRIGEERGKLRLGIAAPQTIRITRKEIADQKLIDAIEAAYGV